MSFFSMKTMTPLRNSIFLLPFLIAGLVTLSACDSNSSDDSQEIDGEFTLEQLQFTVGSGATALSINVLDTLSMATIDLLGGSETFTLEYLIEGETGRSAIPGSFTATEDRVTLNFNNSSDLNQLLLPSQLQLDITENGSVLEGEVERRSVDLRRYNEDKYRDFGTVNRGMLMVRFRQAGAATQAAN